MEHASKYWWFGIDEAAITSLCTFVFADQSYVCSKFYMDCSCLFVQFMVYCTG